MQDKPKRTMEYSAPTCGKKLVETVDDSRVCNESLSVIDETVEEDVVCLKNDGTSTKPPDQKRTTVAIHPLVPMLIAFVASICITAILGFATSYTSLPSILGRSLRTQLSPYGAANLPRRYDLRKKYNVEAEGSEVLAAVAAQKKGPVGLATALPEKEAVADYLLSIGRYEEAAKLYKEALLLRAQTPNREEEGLDHLGLCRALRQMAASPRYVEHGDGLDTSENQRGSSPRPRSNYTNLDQAMRQIGLLLQAKETIIQSINKLDKAEHKLLLFNSLCEVASLYDDLGDVQHARESRQAAIHLPGDTWLRENHLDRYAASALHKLPVDVYSWEQIKSEALARIPERDENGVAAQRLVYLGANEVMAGRMESADKAFDEALVLLQSTRAITPSELSATIPSIIYRQASKHLQIDELVPKLIEVINNNSFVSEEEYRNNLNSLADALKSGKYYQEALPLYDWLIDHAKANNRGWEALDCYTGQAQSLEGLNRSNEALALYTKAEDSECTTNWLLSSEYSKLVCAHAKLLLTLDRPDEARKLLQESAVYDRPGVYFSLAGFCISKEKYELAKEFCDKSIEGQEESDAFGGYADNHQYFSRLSMLIHLSQLMGDKSEEQQALQTFVKKSDKYTPIVCMYSTELVKLLRDTRQLEVIPVVVEMTRTNYLDAKRTYSSADELSASWDAMYGFFLRETGTDVEQGKLLIEQAAAKLESRHRGMFASFKLAKSLAERGDYNSSVEAFETAIFANRNSTSKVPWYLQE